MPDLKPVLKTNLSKKEIKIIRGVKDNLLKLVETPEELPEGILSIAVHKSKNHIRMAFKRLDGFFEYKFIERPLPNKCLYLVIHHKVEAPTDQEGVKILTSLGWVDPVSAFDQVWEQVKGRRTLFKIPDSGKMSVPFTKLHFWGWLSRNETEGKHNTIISRQRYLNELGFNLYKHTLSSEDLKMLNYTIDYHWYTYHSGVAA